MRQYGSYKSTEFTAKQVGVIYRKAKIGELKMEKWFASYLYDLADYYGHDYNRSVEQIESYVLDLLEKVFANNIEDAQDLINEMQNDIYSHFGEKMKNGIDRAVLVA